MILKFMKRNYGGSFVTTNLMRAGWALAEEVLFYDSALLRQACANGETDYVRKRRGRDSKFPAPFKASGRCLRSYRCIRTTCRDFTGAIVAGLSGKANGGLARTVKYLGLSLIPFRRGGSARQQSIASTTFIGVRCVLRGTLFLAAASMTMAGFASARAGTVSGPELPPLIMIRTLPTPGVVPRVIWNSDGTKLAANSLGQSGGIPPVFYVPNSFGSLITIWNSDGTIFRKLERTEPFFDIAASFAFVANDKEIVAPPSINAGNIGFSVFDIQTGRIVREVAGNHPGLPSYQNASVNAANKLVASPDEAILAVIFGPAINQPVALYSTKDWTKLADLPDGPKDATEEPQVLAFSRNGKLLAVARVDNIVVIYDVRSRRVIRKIDAFPDIWGAAAIDFSPDGSMIAVGSSSTDSIGFLPGGTIGRIGPAKSPVRVFKVKDGSIVAVYSEPFLDVETLVWNPDGRFLAFVTGGHLLHLWDPFQRNTAERRIDVDEKVHSLAFSPDGRGLAVASGPNVKIFSVIP